MPSFLPIPVTPEQYTSKTCCKCLQPCGPWAEVEEKMTQQRCAKVEAQLAHAAGDARREAKLREELEKLREFDPATQRSLDAVDLVRITPTGYGPLVADALRADLPDQLEQLLDAEAMEQLLAGDTPEGMRRLMGLAWGQPASLLDYLPEHTLIALDERRLLASRPGRRLQPDLQC